MSELGLINSGIKVGLEINQAQLAKFKEESDIDKIYGRTLDLLARRPRSEWELRDYLKRKKVDEEGRDKLLNKLSASNYIDDEDFARRWVDSRRLLKFTSKRKLSLELKQKRISDETISKVLTEDDTNELEVLKKLIEKKRTQTRYRDDTKLMQYLIRQGFNYCDIKQALTPGD